MTVKTARGVLGFDAKPTQTHRAHYSTKFGDGKRSIVRTGNGKSGADKVKAQDFNTQVIRLDLIPGEASSIWLAKVLSSYVVWDGKKRKTILVSIGSHWATLGRNGWTHYSKGGKLHKFTRKELRRSIQWFVNSQGGDVDALHMLRRGHTGERPLLWVEAIEIAEANGVVLTPEVKSQAYKTEAGAETIVGPCRTSNYPCWPMALLKMKFAMQKCAAFERLGAHFALIFGKFRSQARGANKIKHWPIKPSIIWGPVSARQWLRA